MAKIGIILCLLSNTAIASFAQPANNAAQFEKQYKERIQKEYLDDVYIPKDLTDAFVQLNRLIDSASKEKIQKKLLKMLLLNDYILAWADG